MNVLCLRSLLLDATVYMHHTCVALLTISSFSVRHRWYHGKLDRTIAEERLRQARNPGSYLIRESDRRPGSFVLSFLSMTNMVNHFRYDRNNLIPVLSDAYLHAIGKLRAVHFYMNTFSWLVRSSLSQIYPYLS